MQLATEVSWFRHPVSPRSESLKRYQERTVSVELSDAAAAEELVKVAAELVEAPLAAIFGDERDCGWRQPLRKQQNPITIPAATNT